MNEHETPRDFSSIPAAACLLVVGEFEIGDNGAGAKTAPVRLVARSGKPIEHWFWGRVVHDLSGMQLHKPRLPIDYVHDAKEVIGYLNRFDTESGDLVTSGALVPFKDSDRATEILHKMRAGVPYEASINFGGDGIKVEEIAEGQVCEVNGARFDGPGIVIREWPLRGVAICPYGADANTDSSMLADKSKVFAAAVVSAVPQAKTEEPAVKESVDVAAQAVAPVVEPKPVELAAPAAAVPAVPAPVEAKPPEAAPVEAAPKAVEAAPVEAAALAKEPEQKKEPEPVQQLSREEFVRIADAFGADIAAQTVREGGDYSTALAAYAKGLKDENATLRGKLAEFAAAGTGKPAQVTAAKDKPVKLFNTGK